MARGTKQKITPSGIKTFAWAFACAAPLVLVAAPATAQDYEGDGIGDSTTTRQPAARPAGAAKTRPVASQAPAPRPVADPSSESAALNAEQAAVAAAWLKADTEARRIQAEKLTDFERRQAEFIRQQAIYTQQQADYRAALAAQQAEVARIDRLNADIEACNRGDRPRCPS